MDATLLRSPEDILKSLIRPDENVEVVLLCCDIILLDSSLIIVCLMKMSTLKCLILSVKVCKSLSKLTRMKRTSVLTRATHGWNILCTRHVSLEP
jgi:hypothetical protein